MTSKHPKGLYLLFFTELWERFGFYTLQTIIILYMTKGLRMPDNQANLLYAAMSSLLYLTPIIGGYIADRYLGFQRTIIIGGVLFILAYTLAAFQSKTIFFLGMSLLICANGFFKPNVSAIVGELYEENDPRRDGGFTLFYMGINIGALIPPLFSGALVAKYGWHAGFIAAAVGMLIGQIIFLLGKKSLGNAGLYPQGDKAKKPGWLFYLLLTLATAMMVLLCQVAFQFPEITNTIVTACAFVLIIIVTGFLFKEPLAARKKMFASLVLILISAGFWALYNQTFTSLMLFADRNMAKNLLGIPLNAEATQFFNPFFIIALSPLLSRFWIKLDNSGLNPKTPMKFGLGMLFMTLGYFTLAFGAEYFSVNGLTSPWWLILSYLLQTIGELLISPIGLAMITVLSPKHLVGMMMGVWFFAQAASFALSGVLANVAALPEHLEPIASLPFYSHAFFIYGLIAMIMTILTLLLVPFLNRLIKNRS